MVEVPEKGGWSPHTGVGILGCPGASDVVERLLIPGALKETAAGSTVGGEKVPTEVAEGVEDSWESVAEDSKVYSSIVNDSAAGTVVLGCMFHASGGSDHVKSAGRYIVVTVRNTGSVTGKVVESVTEANRGFEASIGLIWSKLGMV